MRFLNLSIVIFISVQFYAQDSARVLQLNQKFKEYIFKNSDSAQHYIQLLKKEKGQSKKPLPTYYYNQNLGQYHFVRGLMDSSEYHYKKAYNISRVAKWDRLAIDSKIWLANHQYFKGNMQKMTALYHEVLLSSKRINYLEGMALAYGTFAGQETDLSKKMNGYLMIDSLYAAHNKESSNLARVYVGIANLYVESHGNYKLAQSYLKKSSEISKRVNYPPGLLEVNSILFKIARLEKDYDKAIQLSKELLEHGLKHDDPTSKNLGMIRISQMHIKKGDLQNAAMSLNQAKYLLQLPKSAPLFGRTHLLWAEFYLKKNNYEKSFYHLNKARENPDLTDGDKYFMEVMEVEIKYFEAIRNFKKAYTIKQNYDLKNNAANKERNKNRFILEEQIRLKTENLQKLELLASQNELIVQKQKSQRNSLLGGIGLTSIAGLFLFILYRNRQRTNKKLRDIDDLKTNFFTNISHELRTPLTVIKTPIIEVLDSPDLSSETRKHFELAKKNSEKLETLIDQLLELSKIDSGNRKLLIQENYPTQMIAAWCESFLYLAQQKEIDFKVAIVDEKKKAWFDREALENITINLLGNAIKYTPEKGNIDLYVNIQNENLFITVRNSGDGIRKDQIKTIFNRFYQTDGENEGTGIGLSLVKELTELHGGKISVTSELKEWTLFEVVLCIDKAKIKNAEIKGTIDTLPNGITALQGINEFQEEITIQSNELPLLLIVEDNRDVRTLLTDAFKKDYKIVQAVNGEEGILKSLEIIPDIIISDVMMPIKNGIELTNILKNDERTSHIPIILLTAKAGDENELIGIEIGADDYITKPFNHKILRSKTASLLALRKKLQSRYSQEVILKPKDIAITSIDEKFLEKVQKILDEKLVESSFSTEQFSKATHMSRMQLHRKLKALTGLSASEFIRSQRLKLAAQILKSSDINISEVGYSVGFNDHAYFSKCFKEAYNCTPSEFSEAK